MENSTNSTSNSSCLLPFWFQTTNTSLQLLAYYILMLLNFLVSLSLHIVVLIAFYRESKSGSAYSYQIYIVLLTALELVTFALYAISFHWCSASTGWFASRCSTNFFVMWYGHHLSFMIGNGLITTRLLLSVSIAVDRALALGMPHSYRTFRKDLHRGCALAICFLVGMSTSIFDGFRLELYYDFVNARYAKKVNLSFVNSSAGITLAWSRNAVRLIGLVLLIVCNLIVIKLYHRRVQQMVSKSSNDKRELDRRAEEKTLVALTVSQSTLCAIDTVCVCLYYSAQYMAPGFTSCTGRLLTPIYDLIFQLTNLGQFFAVFLVRTPIRTTIAKMFQQCWSRLSRQRAVYDIKVRTLTKRQTETSMV